MPNFVDFVLSTCLDKIYTRQEISVDEQSHKNGQDTLKTAFSAVNEVPPRGVEPLEANQQGIENKELTTNQNAVLPSRLALILQKHPDLARLIQLWPEFPEQTKSAIKSLIQSYKTEGK